MQSLVEDDRAVHLGQLAQPGRGELDVEREAAGAQRLDGLVVAEHDQRAGAAAQDPLEAVAQRGAGRDGGQRGAQRVVGALGRLPRALPASRCSPRTCIGARARPSGSCAVASTRRTSAGDRARVAGARRADRRRRAPRERGVDVGDLDDLACRPAPCPGRGGTSARGEAEPGGLGQPARDAGHPADLAGQADLADRDQLRRQRQVVRRRRRRASATARSAAGSVEPDAADGGGVDVAARAAATLGRGARSTASTIATPGGVEPGRRAPRRGAAPTSADQRLHLGDQRPAALDRDGDAGAGHRLGALGQEQPARVGAARRCRRRPGRSSRPRRPGRSGS